jgi:hypothetical protein
MRGWDRRLQSVEVEPVTHRTILSQRTCELHDVTRSWSHSLHQRSSCRWHERAAGMRASIWGVHRASVNTAEPRQRVGVPPPHVAQDASREGGWSKRSGTAAARQAREHAAARGSVAARRGSVHRLRQQGTCRRYSHPAGVLSM